MLSESGWTKIRTLVVDDLEDFRRLLSSMLEQETECEVVGEASDGLEAMEQAEEHQPDLVLLDIGLPTINGIEVARRVRKVSPNSKILFVTQTCSRDFVQVAFRTGAAGYLLKADATDLPRAIGAALEGGKFVSHRALQQAKFDVA